MSSSALFHDDRSQRWGICHPEGTFVTLSETKGLAVHVRTRVSKSRAVPIAYGIVTWQDLGRCVGVTSRISSPLRYICHPECNEGSRGSCAGEMLRWHWPGWCEARCCEGVAGKKVGRSSHSAWQLPEWNEGSRRACEQWDAALRLLLGQASLGLAGAVGGRLLW